MSEPTNDPADQSLPSLLLDRAAYQARLELIVPSSLLGSRHGSNPAAAATVFVMIYVGAVTRERPVRPSTITWMSDTISAQRTAVARDGYYRAAIKSERALDEHCVTTGIVRGQQWYAKDSREPVRDSLQTLRDSGAILEVPGVQTTQAYGRYYLEKAFADLFDPALSGDALTAAIEAWQKTHLSAAGRARAQRLHQQARAHGQVAVTLPDGTVRALHAGQSSEILRAVIEEFAPARLLDPAVIFISQSGEPVNIVDDAMLQRLGLPIDQQRLLPDCLLMDLDSSRDEFWLVEVVHSDGPVTEERRSLFIDWATANGVAADKCRFLTAFESRANDRARRALPVLARNSFAWFADEPNGLLAWQDISTGD